jgi:hypothetical protein
MSDTSSGLSPGEIVAIAVPLSAFVIVAILAILYGVRNRNYKRLIQSTPRNIQIGKFVFYLYCTCLLILIALFINSMTKHF